MTRTKCGVLLGVLLIAALPLAADDETGGWSYDGNLHYRSDSGRFEMDLSNRIQVRALGDDPDIGDEGHSFEVSKFRVLFEGRAFEHWKFQMQTDLATGSLADDESDSDLLLDAWVQFAKRRLAQLWIGQGKVGFGRQQLIDSGRLQFVDRSIASERFAHGRDVGIALVGENENETYRYSVGVYTGDGINQRSDSNKDNLVAARLEMTPLGPMEMSESDPDWTAHPAPRLAVGVAAMRNEIGVGSFEEETVGTGALEFAFRVRGFSLMAEFFTESRDTLTGPEDNETDTDGWYAQAGYAFPISELGVMEIAGRYSEILFDVVDADQSETGVALGFYVRGHNAKIQADVRDIDFEGLPFGDNIDTTESRVQLQLIF